MKINLMTSKMWRMRRETHDECYMSLQEIILSCDKLSHAPLYGWLQMLQHELLGSLLQVAVSTIGGIRNHEFSKLISNEKLPTELHPLIDKIFLSMRNTIGFNLCGVGAFMQVPLAWRGLGQKQPIGSLTAPIQPMAGRTAKALRCSTNPHQALDAGLTALLLFSHNLLAFSSGAYHSSGILSNRVIAHPKVGKTIRQNLFAIIDPQSHRPQQMPWVTQIQNNRGLNDAGTSPLLKAISAKIKISDISANRFRLSRAILLSPPEQHTKDSSKHPLFTEFEIFNERRILKIIRQEASQNKQKSLPNKPANIIRNIYQLKQDHPATLQEQISTKLGKTTRSIKPSFFKARRFLSPKNNRFTNLFFEKKSKANKPLETFKTIQYFGIESAGKNSEIKKIIEGHVDIGKLKNNQIVSDTSTANSYQFRQILSSFTPALSNTLINQELDQIQQSIQQKFIISPHPNDTESTQRQAIKNEFDRISIKYNGYPTTLNEWSILTLHLKKLGLNMHNSQTIPKQNREIAAGRLFARTYKKLDPRLVSKIQQARHPVFSEAFWICFNKVQRVHPKAFQPLYETLIPLCQYCKFVEGNSSLGMILAQHTDIVHKARIEQIFSETNQVQLIQHLLQIFELITAKRNTKLKIDLGLLTYDLKQFHFDQHTVLRRWATDFFHKQRKES